MKSRIIEAMSQLRSFPLDASRLLWLFGGMGMVMGMGKGLGLGV